MKSFVVKQILLVKNSVNDKLNNNTQLQENSNQKYLTEEIRLKRRQQNKKLHNSDATGKSKQFTEIY